MFNQILSTIEEHRMLLQGDHVTVGLSGGADSVALLCILRELSPRFSLTLSACHINHQLRGEEADADERFCRSLCERLNIPFVSRKIEVRSYCKVKGLSIESGARELRYQALLEETSGKLATAHHADDNAETVLIHLLRGTALDGLCGIAPVRGRIIRPLLGVGREALLQYLEEIGQPYCVDQSNESDEYLRNRIRHHVMPLLRRENPSFSQGILRMTTALLGERRMLDSMAQERLTQAQKAPAPVSAVRLVGLPQSETVGSWDRAALLDQPQPLRLRALRCLCAEQGISFDQPRLLLLDRLVHETGTVQLSPSQRMRVDQQLVSVERTTILLPIPPVPIQTGTPGEQVFFLEGNRKLILRSICQDELKLFVNIFNYQFENMLDCDRISKIITLRSRQAGDTIRLLGRGATKTLKKLMNEAKIPPSLREGLALLADDQGPIWLEGFGVSERVAAGPETQRAIFLEMWEETNDDAG